MLRDGSVKSWVFATLNAGLTVSEYLAMHDDILLEEMSHNDYLEPIIDAILKTVHIVFSYNRDETASKDDTDIEPYCIKLFEHHWYVVGHLPQKDFSSESFAVFDFDCIEDLKMTDRKFRRWKDFDAGVPFADCFGADLGHGLKKQIIQFRVFGPEQLSLKSHPIHSSQKIIAEGEDYTDYEIIIKPTLDFKRYILSGVPDLIILAPQSLIEEIKAMLQEEMNHYNDDKRK